MVSVFVVDQTGLPFHRTATVPQNVVINGNFIVYVLSIIRVSALAQCRRKCKPVISHRI